MPRLQTMGRDWVQVGLGVLALGLASCAVVPPQGSASQNPASQGATAQGASLEALAEPGCRRMEGQRARLQAVQASLAREGMALRVLGCPQLPGGKAAAAQQVIAVAVAVVDGVRAADTVRGPLADGELLDMGSAAPQSASSAMQRVSTAALAQPPRDSLSPDVLYNRAWLRKLMAAQGLRQVGDAWWAFAPR